MAKDERRGPAARIPGAASAPWPSQAGVAARAPTQARPNPAAESPGTQQSLPPSAPSPAALYELALTLAAMGFYQDATKALRDVTARAPGYAPAWLKLAELLRLAGQDKPAEAACAAADAIPQGPPPWTRPTDDRTPAQFDKAELRVRDIMGDVPRPEKMQRLRDLLMRNPVAVCAMRALAQFEWIERDEATSCSLLERALELAPGYIGARADLAHFLMRRRYFARTLAQTTRLIAHSPADPTYRAMHANALRSVGKLPPALEVIESLLDDNPRDPRTLCVYAQALHFAGRRYQAVGAYRACIDIAPETGEAWWGLAELRGNFLSFADIDTMRALLQRTDIEALSRLTMLYALGHALERTGDFPASFAAYQEGARLFREAAADAGRARPATAAADLVRRRRAVFTAANLARTAPQQSPHPGPTPIFILGMPRAGSTLVEQILSSHSLVEPTMELPVMRDIVRELGASRALVTQDAYPECVADLTPQQLAALGTSYIEQATPFRSTDLPYFVDKRPGNWLDAGLIHLILPHAKIIDVRREPMAACFAMFKQMLPEEAYFTYDLHELGVYFTEYRNMMRHYATVLPGRIHDLPYERLVEDTETEIRRLLAYCGLPFEDTCLRFWETSRAVATPSAEQVRRPIFRDALQQWRNYEPFLAPLKTALGISQDPPGRGA